jgi:hypothetical protein
MKKARGSLISFRRSNGEPRDGSVKDVPGRFVKDVMRLDTKSAIEWATRRSVDANLGFHRVTHVLRFSGGAAFDRADSTSLTSPSWIRQGATHRARAVARSGSPAPDMYFRVSLKVTPKCKNPYVVGHAR